MTCCAAAVRRLWAALAAASFLLLLTLPAWPQADPEPPEAPAAGYHAVHLNLGYQAVRVRGNGSRYRQYDTPATGFVVPLLRLDALGSGRSLHTSWWQPGDSDQAASARFRQSGPLAAALDWSFSRFTFHPSLQNPEAPLESLHLPQPVWRAQLQAEGRVFGVPRGSRLSLGVWHQSVARSPEVTPLRAWVSSDLTVQAYQPLGSPLLELSHETRRFQDRDEGVARTRATSLVALSTPIGSFSGLRAAFGQVAAEIPRVADVVDHSRVGATVASVDAVSAPAPGLALRGRWRYARVSRRFVGNGFQQASSRADFDLRYRLGRWLSLRGGLGHQAIDFRNRADRVDTPRITTLWAASRVRPTRQVTLGVDYLNRRMARDPMRPPEDIGGIYPVDSEQPNALAPLAPDRRVRWEYRAEWLPGLTSFLSASFATEKRRNRYRLVDHRMNLLNATYWNALSARLNLNASYTRQTFGSHSAVLLPWLSGAAYARLAVDYSAGPRTSFTTDWTRYVTDGTIRVRQSLYGVSARRQIAPDAHLGVQVHWDRFEDRLTSANSYRALLFGVEGGLRF